jgi:hypothetical protein
MTVSIKGLTGSVVILVLVQIFEHDEDEIMFGR